MNAAYLHLITNHLPVIGALATLLLLLGSVLFRQRVLTTAALVGMVLIAISAVVTAIFGEQAQAFVSPVANSEFTDFHVQVGIIARNMAIGVGAGALALLCSFRGQQRPTWLPWAALGMNLLLVASMAWAANTGGKIAHPEAHAQPVQPEQAAGIAIPTDTDNQTDAVPSSPQEHSEMNTFQEQLEFFQQHWPALQDAGEQDGAAAILAYIRALEDDLHRRVLFVFARQGLTNPEWEAGSLDLLIEVADAGISELLSQAQAAADDETRNKRTDSANVISFNLAADLADCWPGNDAPHEMKHYQRGLEAADACLKWREELGKGPGPFSMAWWVKGMHELSLGQTTAAEDSFRKSFEFAQAGAAGEGSPTEVTAKAGFGVLLGAGYVGIAQSANGDAQGKALYEQALAAFRTQLEDADRKDDAEFGISQLEKVYANYAPK